MGHKNKQKDNLEEIQVKESMLGGVFFVVCLVLMSFHRHEAASELQGYSHS